MHTKMFTFDGQLGQNNILGWQICTFKNTNPLLSGIEIFHEKFADSFFGTPGVVFF